MATHEIGYRETSHLSFTVPILSLNISSGHSVFAIYRRGQSRQECQYQFSIILSICIVKHYISSRDALHIYSAITQLFLRYNCSSIVISTLVCLPKSESRVYYYISYSARQAISLEEIFLENKVLLSLKFQILEIIQSELYKLLKTLC